jgi:osmotically-inducible protein OsmY
LSQSDDETLTARVLEALRDGGHVDTLEIAVEVRDQVVHLRGSVDSAMQRTLAEEAAWAAGAVEVVNELEVTGEPISRSARQP